MIDNYDSFTFNIVQYLAELGHLPEVFRNDEIAAVDLFSKPISALVISPGPCSPPKAGISMEVVRLAAERKLPLLGVCLGYQCLCEAFGGVVTHAPYLSHGKVSEIVHDGSGIFAGIPSPFNATRYHSLAMTPESAPAALIVNAKTPDGVIMGARHRELPLHGVQFHPESILTEHGHRLLANFLRLAGFSVDATKVPTAPR